MTEETKKPMQTIKLRVHVLRPDKREYKQQSIELFTLPDKNLLVSVNVPLDRDHVANAQEILAEQLGTGKVSDPILTPAGLAYILQREFEPHFSDPEDDFELVLSEDQSEGWDEPEEETTEEAPSSDDVWEEDDESTTADESWDEDNEGWD